MQRFCFVIVFLAGYFVSCKSSKPEEKDDPTPFPRLTYTTVKIISAERDKEDDSALKHMDYLEGVGASGLVDSTGKPVSKYIKTTELTQQQIDTLSKIFRSRPLRKGEQWNDGDCIPAYRDAILYFNNNKCVAWVNICFGCERTMFVPSSSYMSGFDLGQDLELREFFKKLGYIPEGRP